VADKGFGGWNYYSSDANGRDGLVVIREEVYIEGTWELLTPNGDYFVTLSNRILTISTTNETPTDIKLFYRD